MERAGQVDVQHMLPFGGGDVGEQLLLCDAGVADQHVHMAQHDLGRREGGLAGRAAGHVALQGDAAGQAGLQRGRSLGVGVVEHRHAVPRLVEGAGRRRADAPVPAGDQHPPGRRRRVGGRGGAGLLRLPDRHSRPRSLLGRRTGRRDRMGLCSRFCRGGRRGLRRGAGLGRGGPGHGDGRRSSLGLRGRFERFQIKGQLKILFMHGLLLLNDIWMPCRPPSRRLYFPCRNRRPCGIFGQKSGCFRQDTSLYYTPFVRKRKEGDENFLPSLTGPRRRARKACAISGVCPARPAAGRKKPPAAPRLPRPAGPAPRRGGG